MVYDWLWTIPILSGGICLSAVLQVWGFKNRPETPPLIFLYLALSAWATAHGLSMRAPELELKFYFLGFQAASVTATSFAVLMVARSLANSEYRNGLGLVLFAFFTVAASLLLTLTNGYHHLVATKIWLINEHLIPQVSVGPLYWVTYVVIPFALIGMAISGLFKGYSKLDKRKKIRSLDLLIATVVIGSTIFGYFALGITPIKGIEFSSLFIGLFGFIQIYFSFQDYTLTPVNPQDKSLSPLHDKSYFRLLSVRILVMIVTPILLVFMIDDYFGGRYYEAILTTLLLVVLIVGHIFIQTAKDHNSIDKVFIFGVGIFILLLAALNFYEIAIQNDSAKLPWFIVLVVIGFYIASPRIALLLSIIYLSTLFIASWHFGSIERTLLSPLGVRIVIVFFVIGTLMFFVELRRLSTLQVLDKKNRHLNEVEARYRLSTTAGRVGIWEWNLLNGQYIADEFTHKMLLYSPTTEQKSSELWINRFVHPDDRGELERVTKEYLEGKSNIYEFELRFVRSDDSVIWLNVRGKFEYDAYSKPVKLVGTATDITDRVLAQQKHAESENRLRSLFENANDIIYTHDLTGRLLEINPVCKKITGYKPNQLIGRKISEFIPPKLQQLFNDEYLEEVITAGVNKGIFQVTAKDGSQCYIEYNSTLVYENGSHSHISGTGRDITEKFNAERARRESEKRYRSVFEKSTDAIFIVDKKTGKYVDVNESGIQLTGRSRSELRQLTTQDVVPSGALKRLKSVDESNTNVDFGKVTYLRPDGTQRIALLSSLSINRENVMGIARDITEELALAEKLRQTQKMEAIGTLAGGIAHDFNNILSAIMGYSELILTELPSESSIKNKIEAICNAGERARDLVSQILTFSRKDEQVKLPVELQSIIKDALKILRPAIPTTIDIQTQLNSRGQIIADPSRIHQVIMNLCTNASQAMLATGGTLAISLADTKLEGEVAANAQIPSGNYVELKISDTGTGIPAENLERIFDPFFTTKEVGHGTGLGLSVVHGIINRHMGAVLVESEVGKGTQFEVYLPLSTEENDIKPPQIELTTGGSERILLVDDEQDILEIETQMLEKLGYTVTATNNPIDALEIFASRPEQFDLVITDMTMPTMTGEKLATELDRIQSNIPTIICTGYSELMSKEKAASLGIDEFIMKPIKMVDLSRTIRSVLDKNTN